MKYFDGQEFTDYVELIDDRQRQYIESLIRSSSIDEVHRVNIERQYLYYTKDEADECIKYLKDNQQHPVFDRAAPSQTEIKETIKQQTK